MAKGELPDWIYMAVHPVDTLKAVALRAETKVLEDFSPTNYTGISLADAVRAIVKNRTSKIRSGGVRLEDWPPSDQERLKKGLKPLGHPEHPNI